MKPNLTVLIREDGQSLEAFLRLVEQGSGEVLIILSRTDIPVENEKDAIHMILESCKKHNGLVRIATKYKKLAITSRAQGFPVLDYMVQLKKILEGNADVEEFLRAFSPSVWQQQLRSNLQSMGLLSLPKLRIWILIVVSTLLFFFVIFRLLPSVEIRVWPREDSVSQTANIFLVLSGSLIDIPSRVRRMELLPIEVEIEKNITFDQISKEFVGTNAEVPMTVMNKSDEEYALLRGSRLTNQAGMVFRLMESVIIDPNEEITVRAVADDLDLYGEIIGERGNVPADRKWEFPGLKKEERALVYAENRTQAIGGTTSYTTVLKEDDLELAKKQLKQELVTAARQLVEEERLLFNSRSSDSVMEILNYDELTKSEFHDFVLPNQFLGEQMQSIPVSGFLTYTSYSYDIQEVLNLLSTELKSHIGEGRELLEETLTLDRLVTHVIDYEDDFSWIKLTVDLSGTERHILDPLTPTGAKFAKHIRELVTGKSKTDALRIIKNLPEVDAVEASLWPPWNRTLPGIPSHITIFLVQDR
jgi:hypothetical protein